MQNKKQETKTKTRKKEKEKNVKCQELNGKDKLIWNEKSGVTGGCISELV
jgi:hypothetical protein